MNPHQRWCHNRRCRAYGRPGEGHVVIHSQKERRYQCKRCGRTFTETKDTAFYRMHKPKWLVVAVMTLLSYGCPLQAIVAAFDLDERTVARWQRESGAQCRRVHEHLVQAGKVALLQVQADEIRVKAVGAVYWLASAMEVRSRLWLGSVISPHRDGQLIGGLLLRVRRCGPVENILLVTDGLSSYKSQALKLFRKPLHNGEVGRPRLVLAAGVMIARVIKRRRSRRVVEVARRVLVGKEAEVICRLIATQRRKNVKTRWLALATFVGLGLFASVGTLLVLPVGSALGATTLPAGFTDSPVVSGLTNPTDMELAPDGRLFITEDAGKVRIAKSDGTLATLLNFSSRIDPSGERGLLAITFDPDYSTNHYVYLHFTKKATSATPVHNRVVRVTVGANDRIVAGSEKLIFRLGNQSAGDQMPQYMGGALDFGRDGKLYVVTGYNDTATMAQQLTNLFGKMLRINKDGTIPTDNPFYATTSGKQRAIWALGLRNPFKFAVQPGTGTIFINDVGEHDWEEINHGEAGANFGWPVREGVANDPSYDDPISAYGHGGDPATTGCAITGGTFYNPTTLQFPSQYEGDYFFADFCSGWIRTLDPTSGEASGFATGLERPIDLEVSKAGELYYLAKGTTTGSPASVGRIGYAGS